MNEHQKRLITAFVGAGFAFAVYFVLGQLGLSVLIALISLVAYLEFLNMLLDRSGDPICFFRWKRWSAMAVALLSLLLWQLGGEWNLVVPYLALLVFLLTALAIGHVCPENDSLRPHLKDAFIQFSGLFYIVGSLRFVPFLHGKAHGPVLLLLLLLIIWGGDSAAYYAGKQFGRHKLSPVLSPGKSIEGGIAAVLFAALAAVAIHYLLLPSKNCGALVGVAALTSLVAQAGDLLESLMKRVADVKDSGSLFPGHGGVFDRFDSLILAAPFFYFMGHLFQLFGS